MAGFNAARETFVHPEKAAQTANADRLGWYAHAWAMYESTAFDDLDLWASYITKQRLYGNMRLIYNPVERLVDFYAGQVWPGVLSTTGRDLPEGIPLAIPLVTDNDDLRDAIGQWWQWSNWQDTKNLFVRYGAMTGVTFAEVTDDLERQKVYGTCLWPGLISDVQLDPTGNVTEYQLEYDVMNVNSRGEAKDQFRFRKHVTREFIAFFKDDKPFKYAPEQPAKADNPYGFVPAVWVRHKNVGTRYGSPCFSSSLSKLDTLNSLASHSRDHLHKLIESPVLIATDDEITPALEDETEIGSGEAVDYDKIRLLKTGKEATTHDLKGALDPSDALDQIKEDIKEIEADHPELSMYRELRSMSQITGPAASRLLGDVQGRVTEAASNYDRGAIALKQMSVAIGGFRFNRGQWTDRTAAQKRFAPFDLSSYVKGDLNFTIAPRPLIEMTPIERVEYDQKRHDLAKVIAENLSYRKALESLGITDPEKQTEIIKQRTEEDVTLTGAVR